MRAVLVAAAGSGAAPPADGLVEQVTAQLDAARARRIAALGVTRDGGADYDASGAAPPPDAAADGHFAFAIREPLNEAESARGRRPTARNPAIQPSDGTASAVSIRSLNWSAAIAHDGMGVIPLAYGAEAVITSPDDATLRSVVFEGP